jgi:hypothetical protein
MERNRKILDKQELYLYFCDISFDNAWYPIFHNVHLRGRSATISKALGRKAKQPTVRNQQSQAPP